MKIQRILQNSITETSHRKRILRYQIQCEKVADSGLQFQERNSNPVAKRDTLIERKPIRTVQNNGNERTSTEFPLASFITTFSRPLMPLQSSTDGFAAAIAQTNPITISRQPLIFPSPSSQLPICLSRRCRLFSVLATTAEKRRGEEQKM